MAVYRTAPKCPKCGEYISGKYWQPEVFFCGDTFTGWDWDGHVCRLGTKYFIERKDTNQWWVAFTTWTNDPMQATMFNTRQEAEEFLKTTTDISARIEATVTEHEFVQSVDESEFEK